MRFNVPSYREQFISLCKYRDLNEIEDTEPGVVDPPLPLDEAAAMMDRGYILEKLDG